MLGPADDELAPIDITLTIISIVSIRIRSRFIILAFIGAISPLNLRYILKHCYRIVLICLLVKHMNLKIGAVNI